MTHKINLEVELTIHSTESYSYDEWEELEQRGKLLRRTLHPAAAEEEQEDTPVEGRTRELKAFLLLTVVAAPVISVLVVSGYGFLVWVYQLFAGPPTGG